MIRNTKYYIDLKASLNHRGCIFRIKFIETVKIEADKQSDMLGGDFLKIISKLRPVKISIPVINVD